MDAPVDLAAQALQTRRQLSFERHARVLGVLWVVLGAVLTALGGINLARAGGGLAADGVATRTMVVLMIYGLGLLVTGVAAYRRSVRVILVGMGLSLVPVVYGYVTLPIALIILASRAIRLASPPRRRSRLSTVVGMLLSRTAIGVIAGGLGILVGGAAGAGAGGAVGLVASVARFLSIRSGLDLLAVAGLGAVGGGASGGFSGLVGGLTTGTLAPRVKAFAHLGGLVVGMATVVEWVLNSATAPAGSALNGRTELAAVLAIAAAATAIGTGLGTSLGTWFARFLGLPGSSDD